MKELHNLTEKGRYEEQSRNDPTTPCGGNAQGAFCRLTIPVVAKIRAPPAAPGASPCGSFNIYNGIVNLAARGMLVVSVARRLGSEGPLLAFVLPRSN